MEWGVSTESGLPETHDAVNVLLLTPEDELVPRFDPFTQHSPSDTNVLAVTRRNPTAWVGDWESHVGEGPNAGGLVAIGASGDEPRHDGWRVSTVKHPGDLTGIGIESSEMLSTLSVSGRELVASFDSVTTLLQHADLQQVFQFLHVVTGRVSSADARCYYHLDPTAHDDQTMATLAGLFDATLEWDDRRWVRDR